MYLSEIIQLELLGTQIMVKIFQLKIYVITYGQI
jgi:hypothetical protein